MGGPITSYSNATPSGSFSSNHLSAASEVANTLMYSGSSTCLLVLRSPRLFCSKILAQTFEERMAHLSLGRFRAVLDLGE